MPFVFKSAKSVVTAQGFKTISNFQQIGKFSADFFNRLKPCHSGVIRNLLMTVLIQEFSGMTEKAAYSPVSYSYTTGSLSSARQENFCGVKKQFFRAGNLLRSA